MKEVLKTFNPAAFSAVGFQHLNIFDVRSKQRIPQNAKTAVAIIFPYYNKSAFEGNISAYCAVADYHIVVMEQLKSIISALQAKYPNNSFVPFVDSSPIDEVDMAVKAGLGVKGRNSLLITPKWGSFVFIGEIVTDLECETVLCDYSHCMGCNLCLKCCPGKAIEQKADAEVCGNGADGKTAGEAVKNGGNTAADGSGKEQSSKQQKDFSADNGTTVSLSAVRYTLNCENCASFISQKKQELTEEQTAILKRAKTVFGCDICQKVCPHNKPLFEGTAEAADAPNLFSDDIFTTVTAENVAEVYKQRPFGFRGLKVLQRNIDIYKG